MLWLISSRSRNFFFFFHCLCLSALVSGTSKDSLAVMAPREFNWPDLWKIQLWRSEKEEKKSHRSEIQTLTRRGGIASHQSLPLHYTYSQNKRCIFNFWLTKIATCMCLPLNDLKCISRNSHDISSRRIILCFGEDISSCHECCCCCYHWETKANE